METTPLPHTMHQADRASARLNVSSSKERSSKQLSSKQLSSRKLSSCKSASTSKQAPKEFAGRADASKATSSGGLPEVLRREFFARAAGAAMRYGVSPNCVLEYCEAHRPASPLHVARLIAHLEDLTHVVACLGMSRLAWSDLSELHEPALIRVSCDHIDELEAVVRVRGWLAALRHNTLAPAGVARGGAPTLGEYGGLRPLRHWLAERLLVELARESPPRQRRLRLTGQEFGIGFTSAAR